MRHRNTARTMILMLVTAAVILSGCAIGGDPESLDTAEQGGEIYARDVNGGMTPDEAYAVVDSAGAELEALMIENHKLANAGLDPSPADLELIQEGVLEFKIALNELVTNQSFYDAGVDFFEAAVRYELSKFTDPPAREGGSGEER